MIDYQPKIEILDKKEIDFSVVPKLRFYGGSDKTLKDKTYDWVVEQNAEWIGKVSNSPESIYFNVNDDVKLKIPISSKSLIAILEKAKYILRLEEDWDDEGAMPYSIDSWKAGAQFLISFYSWLHVNAKGSLHNPKMHHGPNGTIDIAWNEDNFRLFINIDKENNVGTFYSDTVNNQYSEGQFSLTNVRYHMLPIPYKY